MFGVKWRNLSVALGVVALAAVLLPSPWTRTPPAVAAAEIQISRAQFAQYIDDLSEGEGYFDTDNFISNETSYLHVIPELRQRVKPGGVYLGVGPDQNFSYIVHTRPALAIITDIRRQNMLEHLLYKALFDMSASRAEFLALLVSRSTPRIASGADLEQLLAAVRREAPSAARYRSNVAAIRQRLMETYGLRLSARDLEKIEYTYNAFFEGGLDLRFSSLGRNNAANYPTLQSLLLETDRTGKTQGYLSSEELFLWMKKFQAENRLVPIVGDFAGTHAFTSLAAFLNRQDLKISAFYTSNVEYYLFDNDQWARYVDNVRGLPIAADAVFIRAYFGNDGRHPQNVAGHRSTTLIHSLPDFLREQRAGRIRSYWNVVNP